MNPILKEAIAALSSVVNTSTGLAHPLDDSRAKELFKALHKIGVPLIEADVLETAIKHSWPTHHAATLAALAGKIGGGGRVQIKHPKEWGERVVKIIIAELNEP